MKKEIKGDRTPEGIPFVSNLLYGDGVQFSPPPHDHGVPHSTAEIANIGNDCLSLQRKQYLPSVTDKVCRREETPRDRVALHPYTQVSFSSELNARQRRLSSAYINPVWSTGNYFY